MAAGTASPDACPRCARTLLSAAAVRPQLVVLPAPKPGDRLAPGVAMMRLPAPPASCLQLLPRPAWMLSRRERALLRLCRMRGRR